MIVGVEGVGNVVIASVVGLTRAISDVKALVIQRLPSGPAAIEPGAFTPPNSVINPLGVTRANLSTACSVNHIFPSEPVVISHGKELGLGAWYYVSLPHVTS